MNIRQELSPIVYNGLPVLERTNNYVRAHGLVDVVENEIGGLFIAHRVQGSWGIYLLHSHWPIFDGEIPAEDARDGNNSEFLMRPVSSSLASKYKPSALAVTTDGFQALEFSSSHFTCRAFDTLQQRPDFLGEIRSALIRLGLSEQFGLCAVRDPSDENHRWLENSEDNARASIMKEITANELKIDDTIQTSWAFDEILEGRCGKVRHCTWKCGNCYSPGGNHIGRFN